MESACLSFLRDVTDRSAFPFSDSSRPLIPSLKLVAPALPDPFCRRSELYDGDTSSMNRISFARSRVLIVYDDGSTSGFCSINRLRQQLFRMSQTWHL
jgi:hypothetical protein